MSLFDSCRQAHSASTRASSIAVFRQCLYTLFMLKEQLPTLASDTVGQVLPPWLDAFVVLLGHGDITAEIRDGGREGWEGLSIKMEIFKVSLTVFVLSSPVMAPELTVRSRLSSFPRRSTPSSARSLARCPPLCSSASCP